MRTRLSVNEDNNIKDGDMNAITKHLGTKQPRVG